MFPAILPIVSCRFVGDIRSPEGQKLTDEYHNKYVKALQTLWDTNKYEFSMEGTDFRLVE